MKTAVYSDVLQPHSLRNYLVIKKTPEIEIIDGSTTVVFSLIDNQSLTRATAKLNAVRIYVHANDILISGLISKRFNQVIIGHNFYYHTDEEYKLVKITPAQFGFTRATTAREFYNKAISLGYILCPDVLVMYYCIGDNFVDNLGRVRFAALPDKSGFIFCLDLDRDFQRVLTRDGTCLDSFIQPDFRFFFVLPCPRQKRSFVRKTQRKLGIRLNVGDSRFRLP